MWTVIASKEEFLTCTFVLIFNDLLEQEILEGPLLTSREFCYTDFKTCYELYVNYLLWLKMILFK